MNKGATPAMSCSRLLWNELAVQLGHTHNQCWCIALLDSLRISVSVLKVINMAVAYSFCNYQCTDFYGLTQHIERYHQWRSYSNRQSFNNRKRIIMFIIYKNCHIFPIVTIDDNSHHQIISTQNSPFNLQLRGAPDSLRFSYLLIVCFILVGNRNLISVTIHGKAVLRMISNDRPAAQYQIFIETSWFVNPFFIGFRTNSAHGWRR